jgi:hypothetical protein
LRNQDILQADEIVKPDGAAEQVLALMTLTSTLYGSKH